MKEKTSIRYYNSKPVRARWNQATSEWFLCAVDLIKAAISTDNPRKYWYALKSRNHELSTNCRQLKLKAADGKAYDTDCLTSDGVKILIEILPHSQRKNLQEWLSGGNDPLDQESKKKAIELVTSNLIKDIEVGTTEGLQQIHAFIFAGLYDFAGKIRRKNISKDGFVFANVLYLKDTLKKIDKMPEDNLKKIIDKYVEMNIAHPFMEGNGRATRIWLDQILIKNLKQCVDWSKISKENYFKAMKVSPTNAKPIFNLVNQALTKDFVNRKLIIKGIDYSYYYEDVEM
ncbi:MAG: Fic family protein [Bacilli bacterium]|nr:Fic family protein [Bacilli bacterium]